MPAVRPTLIPVVVLAFSVLVFSACIFGFGSHHDQVAPPPATQAAAEPETDPAPWLAVDAPVMPDTTVEQQPGWDQFAWNSFIALNFPAIAPPSSDPTPPNPNNLRGFPDTQNYKSITESKPGTLTVWETLKEKREVFNHPPPATLPEWNAPIDYGPIRMGSALPVKVPAGADTRIFHQGHKATFDSLDETAEVQSESLETQYPDGTPNPVGPQGPDDSGQVVSPRVYQKVTVNGTTSYYPVLYEVKVNWDFYNYVVQNGYDKSNADNSAPIYTDASQGKINLPYRTSSSKPPGGPPGPQNPKHMTVVGYNSQSVLGRLRKIAADPAGFNGAPPAVGSIHLKAAWIMLKDPETGVNLVPDPDAFHQTTASYFLSNDKGAPILQESLFGLAGLHIIQRVHAGPAEGKATNVGGTFIYATFEHEDIDKLEFVYSNFYLNAIALPPPSPQTGWYPPVLDNAYPVQPLLPYNPILPNTAAVNAQVKQKLAGSFWANYRLRGTQFTAVKVNDPPPANPQYKPSVADPTGIGQPVFLANLLLETNHGLQHFQGQPPGTDPIPKYYYKTPPAKLPDRPPYPSNAGNQGRIPNAISFAAGPFNRGTNNMSHGPNGYNMGGCMGCHGVNQSRGFSFSFVLLSGYLGSATDTQTIFDSQPAKLPDGAN